MRRLASALLAIACLHEASGQSRAPTIDVSGQITYLPDGVKVAGRKFTWKQIRSLEDSAPSADALAAELQARLQKRADTVPAHLQLGEWARGCGLDDAAQAEFEAALALDPENTQARKALGWVKVAGAWTRAEDVCAEKLRALSGDATAQKLEIAAWCGDNGDPRDEWKLLVEVAVADPWNARMIALLKPIVEQKEPHTVLLPPIAGTWRAEVDKTRHHQAKAFAFEAIDFRKVDEKGKTFRGTGQQLEDYYGFDSVIRAAADGIVSQVEDQYPDLPPGVGGKFDEANYIGIEHTPKESTDYGHIRQGSALVHVGDVVKAGQPIARVGNSGASGIPHLHFTLDTPVFDGSGNGEWIGIPWRFSAFRVLEAGGAACDFQVKLARVQEGWLMQFPEHE